MKVMRRPPSLLRIVRARPRLFTSGAVGVVVVVGVRVGLGPGVTVGVGVGGIGRNVNCHEAMIV